jgi:hypothetical protein
MMNKPKMYPSVYILFIKIIKITVYNNGYK